MKSINKLIHDLRNPLNTISINAELGKLLLQKEGAPQNVMDIFDTILAQCEACSNTIADFQAMREQENEKAKA